MLHCNGIGGLGVDFPIRIVIVDENPARARVLEDGLREAGHSTITHIGDCSQLLAQLNALDPDVVLIDLGNPSRDVLEQMFQMSRIVRRPVAMFVDESDTATIEAAIDAGVSAYVVDGLKKERIKHILDMSMSRFRSFSRLKDELEQTKCALEERKLIERAKGILMQTKKLSESAAYALLRKTAMNEKRRIADIARSVVTAAEIFK